MATQSLTNMRFDYAELPLLPNARHYAEIGCIPGGTGRNESHLRPYVLFDERLGAPDQAILFDPQTSGGLFAAIDPSLWSALSTADPDVQFWPIGKVTEPVQDPESIRLTVQ